MKRILLTTTSLVLAAGVAQADVSFSGTAGIALIDDNGARDAATAATAATTDDTSYGSDMFFESYYDFDVTASAESDNGVSVSVGFDMGAGAKIDYNDDDVVEAQGNSIGDADITVGYAGWTLTVDHAGIDNLFDDTDGAQDFKVAGTVAGWSVAMTSDESASTSSYSLSGNVGGVALTLTGTDNDDNGGDASKIAASYAMGNGLTLTASVEDESLASGGEDESKLGFSYAMDNITVGYTSIKPGTVAGSDSFGDEWDFSVKMTSGALVASFAIDEADATTVIADYALGGGASAFAAMHDKAGTASDLTTVGLNFAF
jgi:outer membrane protein OmpU